MFQTDSKVNGTALSSPSTSSQRSDSSLPVLRVAASQTTDTMGKSRYRCRLLPLVEQVECTEHMSLSQPFWEGMYYLKNLFSGDDELSSLSQDASGLEEVMEQLNNTFPHSQGTKYSFILNDTGIKDSGF